MGTNDILEKLELQMKREKISEVTEEQSRIYQHVFKRKQSNEKTEQQVVYDPRLKCLRMLDQEEIVNNGGLIVVPQP